MGRAQDFPVYRIKETAKQETAFAMHRYDHTDKVQKTDFPHRHEFYQVVYITEGQGTHYIDFHAFPIKPPILYFVSAGQLHYWQVKQPMIGYSLLFGSDVLDAGHALGGGFDKHALFHRLSYSPIRLDPEQADLTDKLMDLIRQEYQGQNSLAVIGAYLHILFTQIHRFAPQGESQIHAGPATEIAHRYRRLVSERFLNHRSVEYYAAQLGMSAAYLSKNVKEVTGSTAGEIIHDQITLEAKRLLTNTDLPVEQISDRLLFNDPAYFGRFFKRKAGVSPGAFRNSIQERYQA